MEENWKDIAQNRASLYPYHKGHPVENQGIESVFSDIYHKREWDFEGKDESVSGIGSSLAQTRELRGKLPVLARQFGIKQVLDIPCGDFNWMKEVEWEVGYTGADIVQDLITRNQSLYGRANREFIHLDLNASTLPANDLVFCRDCLVHLSFASILKALANLKKAKIKYLLTTTFPGQQNNEDIDDGGWRPLNFQKAPFFFPKPTALINEQCTEMSGAFRDKSMGLWEIKAIPLE